MRLDWRPPCVGRSGRWQLSGGEGIQMVSGWGGDMGGQAPWLPPPDWGNALCNALDYEYYLPGNKVAVVRINLFSRSGDTYNWVDSLGRQYQLHVDDHDNLTDGWRSDGRTWNYIGLGNLSDTLGAIAFSDRSTAGHLTIPIPLSSPLENN